MRGYLIIYKKRNDDLLYRMVKTKPIYHKGDTTSMGWKVVEILRANNGKTYTTHQYELLSDIKYKIRRIIDRLIKIDFIKVLEISFLYIVFKNMM